jgi:hypothetical protein
MLEWMLAGRARYGSTLALAVTRAQQAAESLQYYRVMLTQQVMLTQHDGHAIGAVALA